MRFSLRSFQLILLAVSIFSAIVLLRYQNRIKVDEKSAEFKQLFDQCIELRPELLQQLLSYEGIMQEGFVMVIPDSKFQVYDPESMQAWGNFEIVFTTFWPESAGRSSETIQLKLKCTSHFLGEFGKKLEVELVVANQHPFAHTISEWMQKRIENECHAVVNVSVSDRFNSQKDQVKNPQQQHSRGD